MNNLSELGKTIVVEGIKAVTLTAGITVIGTVATKGVTGLKDIQFKNLLK